MSQILKSFILFLISLLQLLLCKIWIKTIRRFSSYAQKTWKLAIWSQTTRKRHFSENDHLCQFKALILFYNHAKFQKILRSGSWDILEKPYFRVIFGPFSQFSGQWEPKKSIFFRHCSFFIVNEVCAKYKKNRPNGAWAMCKRPENWLFGPRPPANKSFCKITTYASLKPLFGSRIMPSFKKFWGGDLEIF